MKKPVSIITVALLCIVVLTGCGGPKYTADFTKWFPMFVAEKTPVGIDKVSIEETASGNSEAVFQFKASGKTTEDLYNKSDLIDSASLEPIAGKLKQLSGTSIKTAGLDSLWNELADGQPTAPVLLSVATPKGTKVKIQGKARAKLGDNGWEFSIISLSQDNLPGTPGHPDDRTYIKGTPAEKDATTKANRIIARMREAVQVAAKIDAEEKRVAAAEAERIRAEEEATRRRQLEAQRAADEKAAAEKAARKAAILKLIADGTIWQATWQGADMRGNLALRCGKGVETPDGYSIQAELFVPKQPEYAKPISAVLAGDGGPESPFALELRVVEHEAKAMTYEHRDGSGIGFVAGNAKFTLPLTYKPDTKFFAGTLERNFMYEYGPEGPVSFVFKAADSESSPESTTR